MYHGLFAPAAAHRNQLARLVPAADNAELRTEGLVLEELLGRVSERELFFWSTHAGAEMDFVWRRGDRLVGFEAKWGDAPAMTKSMHIALADLELAALYVVYPGPHRYRLDRHVEVIPIGQLPSVLPAR